MEKKINTRNTRNTRKIKFCLNLIVRNESHVIERLLRTCLPFLDTIVVSDTGSTDNTAEKIRNFAQKNNLDCLVTFDKWLDDFGKNRTIALHHAMNYIKNKLRPLSSEEWKNRESWFICFSDADNVFLNANTVKEEFFSLMDDSFVETSENTLFVVKTIRSNIEYASPFAILYDPTPNAQWKWIDSRHEQIVSLGLQEVKFHMLKSLIMHSGTDGFRGRDSLRFERDAIAIKAQMLEQGETSRLLFYYAQSLRDSGRDREAIEAYLKCERLSFFVEEKYYSLVEAGRMLQERKEYAQAFVILGHAIQINDKRLEAPYYILRWYRSNGLYYLGCIFGLNFIDIKTLKHRMKDDLLFVNKKIHDFEFYDELCVCAHYNKMEELAERLYVKILALPYFNKIRNELLVERLALFS